MTLQMPQINNQFNRDYPYSSWENVYKNVQLWELPWEDPGPHPELTKILPRPVSENERALDLGCGIGTTSRYISSLGYRVDAWDISETAIERARELSKDSWTHINYYKGNVLTQAFPPNETYSLIVDWLFLHDVQEADIEMYFNGVKRSLIKGGIYVVAVIISLRTRFDRPSLFFNGRVTHWTSADLKHFLGDFSLVYKSRNYAGSGEHTYTAGFYCFDCTRRKTDYPPTIYEESLQSTTNIF